MERNDELEKYRMRMWDRYITMRKVYGIKVTFEEFWYEFLVRHIASDKSTQTVYDSVSRELEEKCHLHIHWGKSDYRHA